MSAFFSIITPVLNGEQYIEKTIKSIISQNYNNFEYIIVDGKSSDNTLNIIKNYKNKINLLISEKDKGMYHAIEKGIKRSSGRYILWLNSDDILVNSSVLNKLSNFLKKNNNVEWIVGKTSFVNSANNSLKSFIPYIYPDWIIKNGHAHSCAWGFIQQESVVFSRSLYERAGGLDLEYKMAGDFYLWKKFIKHTSLICCNLVIGAQRKWQGQMQGNLDFYYKEIKKKKCKFSFLKYFRILISLILYPIIYFKK